MTSPPTDRETAVKKSSLVIVLSLVLLVAFVVLHFTPVFPSLMRWIHGG